MKPTRYRRALSAILVLGTFAIAGCKSREETRYLDKAPPLSANAAAPPIEAPANFPANKNAAPARDNGKAR